MFNFLFLFMSNLYIYNLFNSFIKIKRYIYILGVRRTFIKILGRKRYNFSAKYFINPFCLPKQKKVIGIIGCGQFAYSTICFFLFKNRFNSLKFVFDQDTTASLSLAKAYGAKSITSHTDLIKFCDVIYIASNHHTHTEYAIKALNMSKTVFCEKPISVNFHQLKLLHEAVIKTNGKFFVGYNRPHSHFILHITSNYRNLLSSNPISLDCFLIGHKIPPNHWYRNPNEGTRVCGNLGHWIDLFIHLLSFRSKFPDIFKLSLISSDSSNADDNCILIISTSDNDLFSVHISSREEPFEGINETINLQCSTLHSKIDDFRKCVIRNGSKLTKLKNWPKDVGHENSILQPFIDTHRNIFELFLSSYLTISFAKLVENSEIFCEIDLKSVEKFFE